MGSNQNAAHIEKQRARLIGRFAGLQLCLEDKDDELKAGQQRIVEAAIELLNENGLDDLSLRKIAKKLDMQAPALYWHFPNKDSLMDHVAEELLKREFAELKPRQLETLWQEWLFGVCKHMRSAMLAHRDGARIVVSSSVPAPTFVKILEISRQSLCEAGVAEQRADVLVSTAINYTLGYTIQEQSAPDIDDAPNSNMQQFAAALPYLARSTMRSLEALNNGHDEFDDGLRLIMGNA